MTDATNPTLAAGARKPAVKSRENPIIPRLHAPLRTLIIAMSVMCFLSTLAVGALLLIERAVDQWTSQISGQATVQITPGEGIDADAEVEAAKRLLEGLAGVAEVRVLAKEEAAALLEPWLGRANILDELPIPRLLAVTTDQRNPPDFAAMTAKLEAEVKGARLDTHRHWQDELTAMAETLTWLGLAVFAVIAGAAVALVIYATRMALETNREAIEVLYLVGAGDKFIARQVERRFLLAGLRAGLIGMAGGIGLLGGVAVFGYAGGAMSFSSQVQSLLMTTEPQAVAGYALFLLVPVVATLISVVTARLATARILKSIF